MDVSFAGGMHTLKIGSNGIGPALAQGTTIVPGNSTLAQNMSVTLSDGSSLSMPITVGASASSAAQSMNEVLKNSGVRAEAKTQIELFDFQSTGVVSFDLEVANRVPIEISADVTPTNLSNLAIALNKVSAETGVMAVTSTDKTRIILTSDAGDDISISELGAASPAFFGRFVDDDGVAETSPIGTVSVSGAFKTPLSSTSAVTDGLIAGATVSSNTVSGSGADLNISSDTSGNYTVTINSGGAGSANPYVVGETFTIDGTLIGGTTGTHDVTITVAAVDTNGVITSATASWLCAGDYASANYFKPNNNRRIWSRGNLRRNYVRWRCYRGTECGRRWLQCWRYYYNTWFSDWWYRWRE